MAADERTGIDVAHLPHTRGGELTRLSWRGWHVELHGQRVTVPTQPINGKNSDDLDLLLGAGYRMLHIATAPRLSPLAHLRGRLPENMVAQIVAVLRCARRLAEIDCRREAFDVYDCTSRAWQDAGMSIPYALLLRSLRAALPPGMGALADYDRRASATAVHALYSSAIDLWRTGAATTSHLSWRIA